MNKSEFGDFFAFKLEEVKKEVIKNPETGEEKTINNVLEKECLICKKRTNKATYATHIIHKKMLLAFTCSEECFKKYKVKYGI